jgi:hypothetical protein
MLSAVSILTSLLLASASTTASPLQARAGACNPVVAGKGINIVNGQFQLGFPQGPTFLTYPLRRRASHSRSFQCSTMIRAEMAF